MKRNNAGDTTAKKQRRQLAAKARRARRKERFNILFARKAKVLLLKLSRLEAQVKTLQAAAVSVPVPAPEQPT